MLHNEFRMPVMRPMQVNRQVFSISAVLILAAGAATILWPEASQSWLETAQAWVGSAFGWFYMLLVAACMGFVFWLALSRHGSVVLGEAGERPSVSTVSWATMLFSAGIGIALIYYGAYEPLDHYLSPPEGAGGTTAAAREAMAITFLHWGLHGWVLYAMTATVLAWFAYREGLPLALRSPLVAVFGARAFGRVGDLVDGLGILATLVSMFTNVGIGVLLVRSGMNYLFDTPQNTLTLVAITVVMMAAVALAVAIGIEKGIAVISNVGLTVLGGLLLFIFVAGPTRHILNGLVQNTGDYLTSLLPATFNMHLYSHAESWMANWTIFFWAWWIAWTPFVGLFIARVSRGRTVRELIFGVCFIPLGFTLAWLSIFGNTAIALVREGAGEALAAVVSGDPPMALFTLLEALPLTTVVAGVAVFASFVLSLTPVNSGVFMVASLSMRGHAPDKDAPLWMRLFWVAAVAVISLGLLLAGNFTAMQMAVVLCGLPFSAVVVLYMVGLVRVLKHGLPDVRRMK
ncbi:MAG: BCCT family transporter [Azonexus sp.]|jgi:choline/glycine/proline betaine transport protein|nr:BCCT family transporter [Azonexus sp.]